MATSVGPYLERADIFDEIFGFNYNRIVDLINTITDYSGRVSPGKYHAEVYRNAVASIPNGFVFTDINYDTEVNDPNSNFNTATSTYIVPLDGRYLVSVYSIINSGAGGLTLSIKKNGVSDFMRISSGYTGSGNASANGAVIINCLGGDTLKIQGAQSTATNPASLFTGLSFNHAEFTYMGYST